MTTSNDADSQRRSVLWVIGTNDTASTTPAACQSDDLQLEPIEPELSRGEIREGNRPRGFRRAHTSTQSRWLIETENTIWKATSQRIA